MRKFNNWIGDQLALWLSTMGCFYLIGLLVIVPLFFEHPHGFIGWVQYIVQSIFQGVALPVLGYVARMGGEKQERTLNETHDVVMEELVIVKEELKLAREERQAMHLLVGSLRHLFKEGDTNDLSPRT